MSTRSLNTSKVIALVIVVGLVTTATGQCVYRESCQNHEVCYSSWFGDFCYNQDLGCQISQWCEKTTDLLADTTCAAIGLGSAPKLLAVEVLHQSTASLVRPLSRYQKDALGCHFQNLDLNRVRLYYNVDSLSTIELASGFFIDGIAAQTFGYSIYFTGGPPRNGAEALDHLVLLAHELQHTVQYVHSGQSKLWFLQQYVTELCKVGFSYDNHPFERAAYRKEDSYYECPSDDGRYAHLSTRHFENVLHAEWNSNLQFYDITKSNDLDHEKSIWLIAGSCIANVASDNSRGYLGLHQASGRLTLFNQCQSWRISGSSGQYLLVHHASGLKLRWSNDLGVYIGSTSGHYVQGQAYTYTPSSSSGLNLADSSSSSVNLCQRGSCAHAQGQAHFDPVAFSQDELEPTSECEEFRGTSCSGGCDLVTYWLDSSCQEEGCPTEEVCNSYPDEAFDCGCLSCVETFATSEYGSTYTLDHECAGAAITPGYALMTASVFALLVLLAM